jgi:hypothetical protein
MGKIELDHTGTGGGITLSSDGTSLLVGGSAVGGAALYAANESSPTAQPSATGANAIAIGDSAVASGEDAFAIGLDAVASGVQSMAFGRGTDATSSSALALGTYAQAVTGSYATAISRAYASGADSFAAAISTNSSSYGATGANSIAIGQFAKAAQTNAVALNGTASGVRSIAIGVSSSATSTSATAVGYLTTAVGSALAIGTDANAQHGYSAAILRGKTEQQGKMAFSGIFFGTKGDAQGSTFVLVADTTDATATVLTGNNLSASTNNQIVAASDTCIMFSGTIVAMQNGAQDQGGWEIRGLLKNDGGTTTLVNSEVKTFADGNGWTVVLSADNTNNALAITCTGEAAHNIRWVANISTSEVTYA